jgi:hypothetical protein
MISLEHKRHPKLSQKLEGAINNLPLKLRAPLGIGGNAGNQYDRRCVIHWWAGKP